MSNWHRIIWIDGRIRVSAYPNCRHIAEHFCISSRQAARDVEYLRDSLGAPLSYCHNHKGYFYTEPTFALPSIVLTSSQLQSLSYLSYRYEKTGDQEGRQLAELFRRLTGPEGSSASYISDSWQASAPAAAMPVHSLNPLETGKFQALQEAIRLQLRVSLEYYVEGIANRMDSFSPVQLFPYGSENCVMGYDETAGLIRLIALRSISSLRISSERYAISPLFGSGEVVPVAAEEPYSAIVALSVPECAILLQHRYELVEGRRFRIYFRDPDRLCSVLLHCPCDYRIVKPGWLRNMLQNRLQSMLQSLQPHYPL
jgi:predicted DNA-binding transcriptional regulator YafY